MNRKQFIGKLGEDYTADYLIGNGYKIIRRNYREKCGEIDIIVEKRDKIAFVEVKTRKENSLVSGAEAVDYNKQNKIIKTAQFFLHKNQKYLRYYSRFDVAEVTVTDSDDAKVIGFNYYENAFILE